MNSNCTSLLKEHGWRVWFSNFLGYSVLFWFISWVSTTVSIPTSCGEFFNSLYTAFSSPVDAVKFLLFTGLFLLLPAFLQSAGTSIAIEAISRNRSNIDTYFSQGFKNLCKMYRLTLTSVLCYVPALFVTKHATFQFSDFSFSQDNVLSLLAIVLYVVTGLSLLHAPLILIAQNTTSCEAIRQSFKLLSTNCKGVSVSLLNVALIYGIVIGSAYHLSPDVFNSLHPTRVLLASLALSLSIFAVAYRYYKHFNPEGTSAHVSGGCSTATSTPACCEPTTTTCQGDSTDDTHCSDTPSTPANDDNEEETAHTSSCSPDPSCSDTSTPNTSGHKSKKKRK